MIKLIVLYLSIIMASYAQQPTWDITVKVTDASSNSGKMFIAVYDSKDAFLKDTFVGERSLIEDNSCKVTFKDIPKGEYAVSVFHDENDNGEMDTNLFGVPKEDYGCSNGAKGFMGPPKWEDAKFTLADANETIHIKL